MALTDKLTAIANAIRAKTGGTATMTLEEMPSEIESIPSGGITPTGSIEITENDTYDVTQYAEAVVNVSGGGATENEVVIATDISISTDTFNAIFAGVTFDPNSIYCCYWKGIKTNATPITDQFGCCVFCTDANGAIKVAPYTRFRNNGWSGVTGLGTNFNGGASANDVYVWLKVG